MKYLILIVVLFNLRAYYLMFRDKKKAIKNKYRIPEKNLFQAAFVLGGVGMLLGMLPPISHKKNKWYFWVGAIGCIIVNAITVYGIHYFFIAG